MIKIEVAGKGITLEMPESKAKSLDLNPNVGYEFYKVKPGVWILAQKDSPPEPPKVPKNDLDFQILKILKGKTLSNRVEGKFEKFLNPEQKRHLKGMLREGKMVQFRLSDKYKKAVYKSKDELEEEQKQNFIPNQNPPEVRIPPSEISQNTQQSAQPEPAGEKKDFSLEKDGFIIATSDLQAKIISEKFENQIKKRELLGIRSFSGEYFIMHSAMFEKFSPAILKELQSSPEVTLEGLCSKVSAEKELIRGICELLKEQGEIVEKRKELYRFVG